MATPEVIEMAPSGGNETWIRRNWTLVLFVVLLCGFVAGLVYLIYVTFVKSDCTCGVGGGKTDCDQCKPKQGMPADTSCQSDANRCKMGGAIGSFWQWLGNVFGWLASHMWVTGVAGLVLLLAAAGGIFFWARGRTKGDTMPSLSEASDVFEDNKRRAKQTEADYKEYEEFIDEKLKQARDAGDTAEIAKVEKQQKTFQEAKKKMATAMEDSNAARFTLDVKTKLKANEKLVTQMIKAEEALGKVRKTLGEAVSSKTPSEDTANKINEEADTAMEEGKKIMKDIADFTPEE